MSGRCVKITKLAAAANARHAPDDWATFVPGRNPAPGKSLPVDFEIEGQLLLPLVPGRSFAAFRHKRNGIHAEGIFTSSAVQEIYVVTCNSVYRVSGAEDPVDQAA